MTHFALYAAHPEHSKGRFIDIAPSSRRDAFQRDRDRIIHSKAFRRLAHKTQVFLYDAGDHYRNRLTHSLEVAQIARTLARLFKVNEDLTELTALAHDLGHPPFGHSGEEALNQKMHSYGGFDHNAHALRLVTLLENRYPDYNGLNLTIESLESILKHNGPISKEDLPWAITQFEYYQKLDLNLYAGIEAQIAALCDDIAYNAHDIDDGIRAKLFTIDSFKEIELCDHILYDIKKKYPDISHKILRQEFTRHLISYFVDDMTRQTKENIQHYKPQSYDDIRTLGKAIVDFSPKAQTEKQVIKTFLMKNMYRHPVILDKMHHAQKVIGDLFDFYWNDPSQLPEHIFSHIKDQKNKACMISDFIAGMTDKFALEMWDKHL